MTIDETTTMREAVHRGFTWLKREGPALGLEWERIRVDRLDMSSGALCVLVQSSLDERAHFGSILNTVICESLAWSDSHGFSWPGGSSALTNEWRRVLTEAREEQDQADLAEALLIS